jgi:hypothetical protein
MTISLNQHIHQIYKPTWSPNCKVAGRLYATAISRFRFICNAARESKISIIDAEQSDRQPAIEYIVRVLSKGVSITAQEIGWCTTLIKPITAQAVSSVRPAAAQEDMSLLPKCSGAYMNGEQLKRRTKTHKDTDNFVTVGEPSG